MVVALTQTNHAKGITPTPYPSLAGQVVAVHVEIAVPASGVGTVANDIYEMIPVPAGCTVRDIVLDADDMDSGTAFVVDVGWMSGTPGDPDIARTVAAEFWSGSTLLQTGGVAHPTLKTAYRQTVRSAPQSIGVKVTTAPGTGVAGTLGMTVLLSTN